MLRGRRQWRKPFREESTEVRAEKGEGIGGVSLQPSLASLQPCIEMADRYISVATQPETFVVSSSLLLT